MNKSSEPTTETTTETVAPVKAGDEDRTPNAEAAKYRVQLRDTETRLEAAQTALTAARGELVRNAVTGHKVSGNTFNIDALDDAGIDPDGLFDDDGKLNAEAIDQTMTDLAGQKPYLFTAPERLYIPGEGKSPDQSKMGNSWAEAFSPEA